MPHDVCSLDSLSLQFRVKFKVVLYRALYGLGFSYHGTIYKLVGN